MLTIHNQYFHLTDNPDDIVLFTPTISAVACFIESQQQLLLLKTDNAHKFQNKVWGAPGGKLEPGELPIQAAVREIFEETGLSLVLTQLHFVTQLYVRAGDFDYNLYIYKTILNTPINEIQIIINSQEHNDFMWIAPKEALQLSLISGEKELIEFLYLRELPDA